MCMYIGKNSIPSLSSKMGTLFYPSSTGNAINHLTKAEIILNSKIANIIKISIIENDKVHYCFNEDRIKCRYGPLTDHEYWYTDDDIKAIILNSTSPSSSARKIYYLF